MGGEWSSKPPACRFVDCGAPARPDRGSAVLLNSSTTVGSVVKYECEDDYWLDGPAELYCTKEGKWSGDAPVCELVTCDTPHVSAGSFVVGYDYNVHSKIQYNCDPGHVLRGNPTLECLESGEWSSDAPFCECKSMLVIIKIFITLCFLTNQILIAAPLLLFPLELISIPQIPHMWGQK